MSDPFFFGYGSLVNARTHTYDQAQPARVAGWRRVWRHTSLRDVAYLTVHEAPGHHIDGLIAAVPNADWVALDLREKAYDRLNLPDHIIHHNHPEDISVQMYKTKSGNDAAPSVRHPILLSYLDTVVQGYHDVFGQDGVEHFFATTDGWEAPIQNDLDAPVYPRHTPLTPKLRKLVDDMLGTVAVTVVNTPLQRRW